MVFGQTCANNVRRRRSQLGEKWNLDDVFLNIKGKQQYLWWAVDQDGNVVDILVQSRRNTPAVAPLAKRFFRMLLKSCQYEPRLLIRDKLASYAAAKQEVMPGVEHRKHERLNNRAGTWHQPMRKREDALQGFK